MNDQDFRNIVLFFYFSLLDSRLAKKAIKKTFHFAEKRLADFPSLPKEAIIIFSTYRLWNQLKGRVQRGKQQGLHEIGWNVPEHLDLGSWKEFQKNNLNDELFCVIWTQIIGYSEKIVSHGLGLSEGTIHYRVGRGIKKIGLLNNPRLEYF